MVNGQWLMVKGVMVRMVTGYHGYNGYNGHIGFRGHNGYHGKWYDGYCTEGNSYTIDCF